MSTQTGPPETAPPHADPDLLWVLPAAQASVVHNDLCIAGWVGDSVRGVLVDVADRRFLAELQPVPTLPAADPGAAGRVPFGVTISTREWPRGRQVVRVSAINARGERTVEERAIDIEPYVPMTERVGQLFETAREGRTQMWIDFPAPGAPFVFGEQLRAYGWAQCRLGIDRILADLDGRALGAVRGGQPRVDLEAFECRGVPVGGWELTIDASGLALGPHVLTVVVVGRDGLSTGLELSLHRDPDAMYRLWRERRMPPAPLALGLGAPLTACLLGDAAALEPSLRAAGHEGPIERDLTRALQELAEHGAGHLLVAEGPGTLAPGALALIAQALDVPAAPDLVYADEDAIVHDGGRGAAFLKPEWSPELLLSTDYVGPFIVLSARAAALVLDGGPLPLQSRYDLLVRLIETPIEVVRVPEVLFTGAGVRARPAGDQARGAIEHLGRRLGLTPQIAELPVHGMRHVGWKIAGRPRVSVVIPSCLARGLLRGCLWSLRERSSWPELEVIVVDSSGGRIEAIAGIEAVVDQIVPYEGEFSFSRALELGAKDASGELLVALNDDTEIVTADWIERMLEHAQLPGVGAVGAKLLFPGGQLQHAGVTFSAAATPQHPMMLGPGDMPGYESLLTVARNVTAVTGACMMVRLDRFRELGGFASDLPMDFGDVDLCLRMAQHGWRSVITPRAVLVHHTTASGRRDGGQAALALLMARWHAVLPASDRFYHPAFHPAIDYWLA